jgi:4-hydroxy-tetrahydrodipicolinate synthase
MSLPINQQLRGTGVAIVTPFDENEKIDFNSLGKIIDFLIDGGVEYIVSLGTTGETPVLDKQEKKDIIDYTYQKVAGRIPVVVGVGGNYTKAVVQELEQLPLDKATAILSVSPAYNKPSQEGIYQHYLSIAASSPLPIILYNVPARTGRNLTAQTTLRLAELPNVAGIKEASGMMDQCALILKEKPENFLVVSGEDALTLPLIASGMDGVISVAANAYPKSFSQMVRYCLTGNYQEAKSINKKLIPVYELLFIENNPAGVKAFMHLHQLLNNQLRLPLVPLSEEIYSRVKDLWQLLKINGIAG